MPDLLVKLYALPDAYDALATPARANIEIRRALATESRAIVEWVERTFEPAWAAECEIALGNRPVTCFIATRKPAHAPTNTYDLKVPGPSRARHPGS